MALRATGSTKKENGTVPSQNSCESPNKVNGLLRPLERKLTNIMVPLNPLKRHNPPPLEAEVTKVSSSTIQTKFSSVASIILNPPFIKITPRPAAPKPDPYQKVDSRTSNREPESVPADTGPASFPIPRASSLGVNSKSGVHLRANRKKTGYFERQELESHEQDRVRRIRIRKPRKKGFRSRPRAARASMRLYQKQKFDIPNKSLKPKSVRVSRTVELVDQSGEGWRDEKSKLLFILSLGLSLKPEAPVLGPQIRLTPIDPQIVAQIEKRYEAERILRLERERVEDEKLRMYRLQFQQHLRRPTNVKRNPIEVIDISSEEDDEDKDENSIDRYILPQFYPNVTIESVSPRSETRNTSHTSVNSSHLKAVKNAGASCIVKPRLVKTLDTGRVNRVRHWPSSKFPRNCQNHIRQPPLSSFKSVPVREKSQIYVAPSAPMKFNDMSVSEMIKRFKSEPYSYAKKLSQEQEQDQQRCLRRNKRIVEKEQEEEVIQID